MFQCVAVCSNVLQYVPVLEEKNIEHVHHFVFYECVVPDSDRHFEKWLSWEGTQCHSANMPVSWGYCRAPIIAWVTGGDG